MNLNQLYSFQIFAFSNLFERKRSHLCSKKKKKLDFIEQRTYNRYVIVAKFFICWVVFIVQFFDSDRERHAFQIKWCKFYHRIFYWGNNNNSKTKNEQKCEQKRMLLNQNIDEHYIISQLQYILSSNRFFVVENNERKWPTKKCL